MHEGRKSLRSLLLLEYIMGPNAKQWHSAAREGAGRVRGAYGGAHPRALACMLSRSLARSPSAFAAASAASAAPRSLASASCCACSARRSAASREDPSRSVASWARADASRSRVRSSSCEASSWRVRTRSLSERTSNRREARYCGQTDGRGRSVSVRGHECSLWRMARLSAKDAERWRRGEAGALQSEARLLHDGVVARAEPKGDVRERFEVVRLHDAQLGIGVAGRKPEDGVEPARAIGVERLSTVSAREPAVRTKRRGQWR